LPRGLCVNNGTAKKQRVILRYNLIVIDITATAYALLIGFIPVCIWVVFWLFEDARRPEPHGLLFRAFFAGMLAVVLVLPLQHLALQLLPGASITETTLVLILVWAAIEEIMKLLVPALIVLRHPAVNEPIDFPIYLITAALGFAALENTLFVLTPFGDGEFLNGFITGNLRFFGATLIHVLSTALIGGALAFAFYRNAFTKIMYATGGVILATVLHTIFNFTIINTHADYLLTVFAGVWVGIVFLLLALERVKLLKRPAWWEKMFIRRKSKK
jgi:protease PrsW